MKSLDVKYDGKIVGKLSQDESGKMSFRYDPDWILNSFAISMSLPLQNEPFDEQKCRPFFEGLLPEDAIREEIARNLGVSSRSDFALLREIGGDCAGAISVGDSYKISSEKYEKEIDDKQLLESLKPLTGKPLFAGEKDVRLSIAGSQRKLPIIYKNGRFYVPHGDIPTTVYPNLSKKMAMKIGNKYEAEDVFKRHWHMLAEDISVKPEFIEKEIKYVSVMIKKWIESVADQHFSRSSQTDVIDRISQAIADNLKRLERE